MATQEKEVKNLTCDDLRALTVGETKTFYLPDARACYTGKSLAYQLQNQIGCKFSIKADFAEKSLTITKNVI